MKKIKIILAAVLVTGWSLPVLQAADNATVTTHRKSSGSQKKSTVALSETSSGSTKKYSASFELWLKRMKKRVTNAQTKRNRLIAVAAVRGSEVKEAPPLYWKGQKAEGPVKDDELNSFNEAIETALKGEDTSAKNKLETFVSTYPNSPLAAEAKDTLDMLASGGAHSTESSSAN